MRASVPVESKNNFKKRGVTEKP